MRTTESMRRLSTLALTATLAACATAPTADPAPAPPAAPAEVDASAYPTEPPPPMPLERVEFPPFHQFELANGLSVLVVEKRDLPLANVDLYVKSGGAAVPADRAGLAGLTAELLTQGTESRTALEIAETIEGVGGNLSAFASDDYIRVSADVVSDDLPLAMDLVSDVTLNPSFPEEELVTARQRALSGLRAALGQPGVLAERRFLREIYGEHPYGALETAETLESLNREAVLDFHRRSFAADNALLVVSGDVDAAEMERMVRMVRERFGGWQSAGVGDDEFVEPPAQGAAAIHLVHRPGSVQSNLIVGHTAIRPDNPDYFPLQVMNKILGGGTDARLFLILREEKGWTYGAYSQLSRPQDIGYFRASAEVRSEVTDSALAELMTQVRRIRDEPVPASEVEAAKSFLMGSFPLRIETPAGIARQIAQARLLGVPIEHVTEYRERIADVDAEDVQRVARQYVRPDRSSIVIVGDATQILDDVEALGIAPVQLYDVGGEPLDRASLEVRGPSERFTSEALEPMTLTYQVLLQGNPFGTATTVLFRVGDDEWSARTDLVAGPIQQESEVRFRDDMSAVSATTSLRQGAVEAGSELRFEDGRVTGSMNMPEQAGGSRTFDTEVVEGTIAPGMDQWLIASADLAPGRTISAPVFNPQSGTVTTVTLTVQEEESVTVPAGTFDAYRVQVSSPDGEGTLWVRRDAPHIPLRQEQAGVPVVLELQEIEN